VARRRGETDGDIRRHLLRDEGEVIVDVVRKHWVVYVVPGLIGAVGVLFLYLFLISPVNLAPVPLAVGLGLLLYGWWRGMVAHMDRFVITNMRVFRIRGVFSRTLATMPMTRILDITVEKPFLGRVLGFGHFVFESAAQDQGLRDIRYVGRPDERDLIIQRLIQQSGLRTGPKPN
jgi:hypothetical protein